MSGSFSDLGGNAGRFISCSIIVASWELGTEGEGLEVDDWVANNGLEDV